jgi:hypothetical protein
MGGGATFFDSPALSKSVGGEVPVGTPQERRKRGTGRSKERTGQVNGRGEEVTARGTVDQSTQQATSGPPIKSSGSGRSVFDSPSTSRRTQLATSSDSQRHESTPSSLKPNGRSVFELPVPLSSPKPNAPRKKAAPKKKSKGPRVVAATSSDEVAVSGDDGTESWYRSATLEDILDELSRCVVFLLGTDDR